MNADKTMRLVNDIRHHGNALHCSACDHVMYLSTYEGHWLDGWMEAGWCEIIPPTGDVQGHVSVFAPTTEMVERILDIYMNDWGKGAPCGFFGPVPKLNDLCGRYEIRFEGHDGFRFLRGRYFRHNLKLQKLRQQYLYESGYK